MNKNAVLVVLVSSFYCLSCSVVGFSPERSGRGGIAFIQNNRVEHDLSRRSSRRRTTKRKGLIAVGATPTKENSSESNTKTTLADRTRKDFKILSTFVGGDREGGKKGNEKELVYLDSAATSQKPNFVLNALNRYYETYNSNVHRGAHTLSREATAAYEGARDKIQQLVNAPSRNEIVFTSGATEAINLVAMTYGRAFLQEGDEIITTEMEHHSNIVPWQILAQEKQNKITIRYVKMDPTTGGLDIQHLESLLDSEKTKLVSIQHVSNVIGCINPVAETIVPLIRNKAHPDCKIVLDACQSVPHMKVDVQQLGIDFLAASGHKMCGPTGIGFLWGKEQILNTMPPFMGGGEMIDQVSIQGSTYAKSPGRFEAGTPPIAQAIGLAAAIDYLNQLGMENIADYEHELSEYLYSQLEKIPQITILGGTTANNDHHRAALCSFVCENIHASDLSTFLDMEGIAVRAGHHCCQPLHQALGYSHSTRASLYFYNTKEDIDTFIDKLKSTIQFFSSLDSSTSSNINTVDDNVECSPVDIDSINTNDNDSDDTFVPFI